MKVTLKNVSGKQYEVQVEGAMTVPDIKKLLDADYDVGSVRLVYKGAILDDTKTATDAGFSENDTIVFTGKKKSVLAATNHLKATTAASTKASPSAPTKASEEKSTTKSNATASSPGQPPPSTSVASGASPTPAEKSSAAGNNDSAPHTHEPSTVPATSASSSSTATHSAIAPASATASTAPSSTTPPTSAPAPDAASSVRSTLIDEIVAMGFEDRAEVALALRAAYMNADRAVEYLIAGIPPEIRSELTAHAPAHIGLHRQHANYTDTSGGTAVVAQPEADVIHPPPPPTLESLPISAPPSGQQHGSLDLRSTLSSIPFFDQVRGMFRHNRELMPVILQQISERYPQVYAAIEAHPQDFLDYMQEGGDTAGTAPSPPTRAPHHVHLTGTGSGVQLGPTTTGAEPERDVIALMDSLMNRLSEEDRGAVNELVELGGGMWDARAAMMTYIATQRDSATAANLLLEHGGLAPEILMQLLQMQSVQQQQHGGLDDDHNHGGEN